jgi:hypothetical protein
MRAGGAGVGDISNEIIIPSVGVGGSVATPAIALAIFGKASWAIPVVGAAIGGITIALALWLNRRGPHQKEAASQLVDELEVQLQANLRAYQSSGRTRADQVVALANFDAAWAWLISPQGCGSPELGEPGRRCIAERQQGGSAPWCPTATGCDWFVLYRDPISSDPVPAETGGDGIFSSLFGGGGPGGAGPQAEGTSMVPLLVLGLITAAVVLS